MKRTLLFLLSFLVLYAVAADANSSIYEPLVPPKAEDIVAFTNGLPPATGVQTQASRKQILHFLRRGKNNLNLDSWYPLESPRRGAIDNCDGVVLDRRGQFVFWKLCSKRTLKLQTPDGRFALLQLP